MPRISQFLGIMIFMFFRDHMPPHIHAIPKLPKKSDSGYRDLTRRDFGQVQEPIFQVVWVYS